jgi:superoxide dismutase, Cu-Zn family
MHLRRDTLILPFTLVVAMSTACDKNKDRVASQGEARSDAVPARSTTGSMADVPAGTAGVLASGNTGSTGTGRPGGDVTEIVGNRGTGDSTTGTNSGDMREAKAEFKSVPTMKLEGDAELEEVASGVRIVIEVDNAPAGQKGIHIHQTDNCSDIANKSMGEHFAPDIAEHGLPGHPKHHLGDLGNITIDKDGSGKLEITVANANLEPNHRLSFIGKSIVIHEATDKGTGPSGGSGKPIACAPIKAD